MHGLAIAHLGLKTDRYEHGFVVAPGKLSRRVSALVGKEEAAVSERITPSSRRRAVQLGANFKEG
jgi:hypothetical protein